MKEFLRYSDHVRERPFSKIGEEFQLALLNPGKPQPVHGDAKSIAGGRYQMAIMFCRGGAANLDRFEVIFVQGDANTYRQDDVVLQWVLDDQDTVKVVSDDKQPAKASEVFRSLLQEAWKVSHIDTLVRCTS